MNNKAIVTLVLGGRHQWAWKKHCADTWREYAERFGYDIILLDEPLDHSERARGRSASWQKCLILGQEWSSKYEQIVWLDADIVINNRRAHSIVDNVPLEKIGAASAFSSPSRTQFHEANRRNTEFWKRRGAPIDYENTPREFYEKWNFEVPETEDVVQAGVMVFSPKHHRDLLELVYNSYEDQGPGGMYEMRALSYEVLQADLIHWVDPRFNYLWMTDKLLHYPFLFGMGHSMKFSVRARRRLGRELGIYSNDWLKRACQTSSFLNCFFLHYAGAFDDLGHVDLTCTSWNQLRLTPLDN